MMRFIRYAAVAMLGLYMATATSCKKKESDPVCRITSMTAGTAANPVSYTFTYNESGKLAKSVATGTSGETRVLSYSGNVITITISKTATGVLTGTETVTLNSAGLLSSIVLKDQNGNLQSTTTYTYDAAGKVQTSTFQYSSFPGTTTTYQFTNGDLTRTVSNNSVTDFDYYADKGFTDGDYFKIAQFLDYGTYAIVNKHLLKSATVSGATTTFTYEYDAQGRIIRLVSAQNGTIESTVNYTYTCN